MPSPLPTSLLIVAALVVTSGPGPQTRDLPARSSGTAVIGGTVVTDDATSRPIRRATVTVESVGAARGRWITVTDDAGRFTVAGLGPGNVTLFASKAAYVTTYFGAKRAGATVGVPIALTDSQRQTDLVLRMPRGAVITGTLFDEGGKPMPAVAVRLQQVRIAASGERTLTTPLGLSASSTDDRGQYRVFGLPPGNYVVSARPRATGTGEIRQPTADELRWAEREVQSSTPASSTSTASAAPPQPGAPMTYANVFAPGNADVSGAAIVTVGAGQERAGVDIRMLFVPTARVEGTVVGPNGQPAAGLQVALLGRSGSDGDAGRLASLIEVGLAAPGASARTATDGSFSLQGVEPGAYTLLVRTAAPGRSGTAAPAPASWAIADVQVSGQNVSGLALTLAPGLNVGGRFVFEGRTPPADGARITVGLNATGGTGASALGPVTLMTTHPTFAVASVIPGTYRFTTTLIGWTLKSAMLGNRDVSDATFEVKPGEDISNLVVTFSDSPADVTGTLTDAAGRPTSSFVLVLFPTDRALWFAGSRRLRSPTNPASDGRFSFTALPAGEYLLAALTEASPAEASDPQFLDQVVPGAIKITLANGEKKTQDVKIAGR